MDIDRFNLFQEARAFYSEYGFKYIETPWYVSRKSIDLTRPDGVIPHTINYPGWSAYLVGSAEQGFLHIYDQLEKGKPYMSITPCFRDDKEDELHQRYFMKLELFMKGGSYSDCDFFKEEAGAFFQSQGVETYTLRTAEDSYDLITLDSRIELGSYYHREIPNYKWACGTGLAQPRFDIARSKS